MNVKIVFKPLNQHFAVVYMAKRETEGFLGFVKCDVGFIKNNCSIQKLYFHCWC